MAKNEDVLRVGEDSQKRLVEFVKACSYIRDEGWQLRQRLEEADRQYMRENDFSNEQYKAKVANRRGDPKKIQNMQTPMVLEAVETSVGFLTNVFGTEYPMFRFAAEPDKIDLAMMWNTMVGEDQIYFGWQGEFNQAFRNGEKYNFAPIEVEWCEYNRFKPTNGTGKGGVILSQQIYAGNRIASVDPYNCIYDPRVPIHKVHEVGEFAGWVKMMHRIQLKMYLASLGERRLKNDVKAFKSPNWEVQYYVPYLNPNVIVRDRNWLLGGENFNWVKWATDEAQKHIEYRDMYTVVCLYARIMPYEFGIQMPRDQTPDVWKLVVVNGVIVFAQPLVNAHGLLPMVIAQPQVDNLSHQTKSSVENISDFQYLANALINAKLASARRRVMDRMLYNPLLIDPDHINSENPSAKIPLRPTAYGRKLDDAVKEFPFHDENSQYFIQEANYIAEWARRTGGQNNVTQGQFQKGNKLQEEFNTVMANAGARDRTKALMWETYAMVPIKIQLKSNYLQFAAEGTRYNRKERQTVNIDPIALRETESEFEVGDGLLPIQRILRSDILEHGFQTMVQVPAIGAKYNLGDVYAHLMKLGGVEGLEKFAKPPQILQYEQALAAWQGAASEMAKRIGTSLGNGKFLTSDDIQKTIGPMPTPPQQQPPTKGAPPNG